MTFNSTLIIQSYYLSSEGFAIRVRLQTNSVEVNMSKTTDANEILNNYRQAFEMAFITVKGPNIGGTRYEVEHEIDVDIAAELIKRGGDVIIKNRFSKWINKDGWEIDVFGGKNFPLIIAECERLSPVVDLEIPPFCIKEITDDLRFANDELSNKPYSKWKNEYLTELDEFLKKTPENAFLPYFGENILSEKNKCIFLKEQA